MNASLIKSTVLGLLFSTSVLAQNPIETVTVEEVGAPHRVITNKFFNNWFIGAGVGGQVYFGEFDAKQSFGDRITPIYNLSIGKWFTPGLGLRIQGYVSQGNGLTTANATTVSNVNWYNLYNTGETFVKDGTTFFKQKIKYGYVGAQAMFNLSNMLAGYNPRRFYNFIPYVGGGLMASYDETMGSSHEHEFAVTAGLLNTFRLSGALDLTLDLQGNVVSHIFSHKSTWGLNNKGGSDQTLSASLGLVYKFKRRTWDRATVVTKTTTYDDSELQAARRRVAELMRANEELERQLRAKPKEVEVIKQVGSTVSIVVPFELNKAVIDKKEVVNVYRMAKYLEENPNSKVLITGYADKGTGNASINQNLSERRVKAVADMLVKRFGINRSRIQTEANGDRIQPFEVNDWNRVVIGTVE